MAERLRIIIEFSKGKERELKLYGKLQEYSVPSDATRINSFAGYKGYQCNH